MTIQHTEILNNHMDYSTLLEKPECLISTNGLIVNLVSIPNNISILVDEGATLTIPADSNFINIHFFPGLFDVEKRGSFSILRDLVQAITRINSDLDDFIDVGIIDEEMYCLGFTNSAMENLVTKRLGFNSINMFNRSKLTEKLVLRMKELKKLCNGVIKNGYGDKPQMGDVFVYTTIDELRKNIRNFLEQNEAIVKRFEFN